MISLPDTHVDGGAGADTAIFTGAASLSDMSALSSILTHVDVIDFTSAGVDATLSVSADQVSSISDSNALTMQVNAGDTISATGFFDASFNGATTTYTFFDDGAHSHQTAALIVNAS